MSDQIPSAPLAVRPAPSDKVTGGGSSEDANEGCEDGRYVTIPDLVWYYNDEPSSENRYRTGGKRLAPAVRLPYSTSFQDSWSGETTRRLKDKPPEVWGINSDSAKHIVNEKVAGNLPLPTTHWNYHVIMRQVVERYQRMKRGGLTCRNWIRVECASENWDAAAESARSAEGGALVECHPVPDPPEEQPEAEPADERNTRRGAQASQCDRAVELTTRARMTQELYDAKILYAKTTHKIEILTQSLSEGARAGYRGSWKHWGNFCRGQAHPCWLDSREERWGGDLMKFILSEHDVLGLKASTIRGKVIGIRSSPPR